MQAIRLEGIQAQVSPSGIRYEGPQYDEALTIFLIGLLGE